MHRMVIGHRGPNGVTAQKNACLVNLKEDQGNAWMKWAHQ